SPAELRALCMLLKSRQRVGQECRIRKRKPGPVFCRAGLTQETRRLRAGVLGLSAAAVQAIKVVLCYAPAAASGRQCCSAVALVTDLKTLGVVPRLWEVRIRSGRRDIVGCSLGIFV